MSTNICAIRKNGAFLYIFLFLFPVSYAIAEGQAFTRIKSVSYSEPTSIHGIVNEFNNKFHSGSSAAFTHNVAEVGVNYKTWSLSVLQRYDYYLDFSPDTAELAYLSENNFSIPTGKNYCLNLHVNHLRAKGLKAGYHFVLNQQVEAKIAATWLQATDIKHGDIRGNVDIDSDGSFVIQAAVDQQYTEDSLFHRQLQHSAKGTGYTLDFYLNWQISAAMRLNFSVEDAISRIKWENLAFTRAGVNTQTFSLDSDGLLAVKPVLSGFEGFKDHIQELPPRYDLQVYYQLHPSWQIMGKVYRVGAIYLPEIGLRKRLTGTATLDLLYDIKTSGIGFSLDFNGLELAFLADKFKLEDARKLNFLMSYTYQF